MATSPGNSINETTTGVCGFTGTSFTSTPATQYNVQIGGATSSTLTNVAPSATSGVPHISQGSSSNPAFGTAVVAGGGTGAVTLTNHGVLIGQATSAIVATSAGTAGQVLQSGGASADPSYSSATYPSTSGTSGNVLTSNGSNWTSAAPAAASAGGFSYSTNLGAGDPGDGVTYYFSRNTGSPFTTLTASTITSRFYIPIDCTLKACSGSFTVAGTLGSNQNCTLAVRKNDTSNTNVSAVIQLTANPTTFSNVALSTGFVAGDFVDIVFISPTWGTNPTTVSISMTTFFTVP